MVTSLDKITQFITKYLKAYHSDAIKGYQVIIAIQKLSARFGTGACLVAKSSVSFAPMVPFLISILEYATGGLMLIVRLCQTTTVLMKTCTEYLLQTDIKIKINSGYLKTFMNEYTNCWSRFDSSACNVCFF